jgi:protein disulfide isomerase
MARLIVLFALACFLCAIESHADQLDDVRETLIQHIKSGAKPDVNVWSRYVATYRDAHEPKKQVASEIPKFKWAQTRTKLTIKVAIPGAKDEKVDFGDDSVSVSGTSTQNGKLYELNLKLFKGIKPKKCKFTVDQKGLYLTIKKMKKEAYWVRLLKTKPVGALKRAMEVDWANWVDEADLGEDDDDDIDEDDVKVLDETNFDSWVTAQKVALVEFYAPWCGHCKQLKPEYAKAATALREAGSAAKLAKVDATKHGSLGSRFGVSGYPTLKVFRGKLKGVDYKGGRNEQGIVSYMKEQEAPSVKKLGASEDDVKNFAGASDGPRVVAFIPAGSSRYSSSQFEEAADELRDEYKFAETTADAGSFVEAGNQVVLFTPHRDKAIAFDGVLSAESLKKWLLLNSLPVLGDLSDVPYLKEKYDQRSLPMMYVFVDAKDPATEAIKVAATDLSTSYSGKYSVVTMKSSDKERMTALGIEAKKIPDPNAAQPEDWSEEDDGQWEAPLVDDLSCKVVIDDVGGKVHYVLPQDSTAGGVTKEVLEEFIKNHEECGSGNGSCNLEKAIKSEPIPTANDEPVKVVVGKNFDQIVMNDASDVLIEFYAPWCGHCKQLAPTYDELAKKLLPSKSLVIAKMDATANDIPNPQFDVQGFPTIYFKAAGKPPVSYNGGRTVKDFVDYLKKEAKHPISEA